MTISNKIKRFTEVASYTFDPRQDIELFGMYGHANIGDEAMRDAGLAILPKGRVAPVVPESGIAWLRTKQVNRNRRFLVIGGGTLIHGGSAEGHNPWLDYIENRVVAGAKITTFGTGVAFTDDQVSNGSSSALRWKKMLDRAQFVGVRGPRSQKTLSDLGVQAQVFGDAVFSLFDPTLTTNRTPIGQGPDRIFGLNLGRCHQDQDRFNASMARIAGTIGQDFRIRVFVARPHDLPIAKTVMKLSGLASDRFEFVCTYIDARQYMKQVAECVAFTGIKMHTSGLAMVAGVPATLCSYRDKCRDFAIPIGMEHALYELPVDENHVLKLIEDSLKKPEDFTATSKIAEFAASQRQTAAQVFLDA